MSAVLRRTWRRAWEGRFSSAALILFVPLFFSTLFGFVYYQNVVKHVPLLILDEDQSSSSRAFAQMFADADAFDVVGYAGTEEELSARVQSGEVVAGLGIPADFSKKLKQGAGTNVLFLTNSENNTFGSAAISAADSIIRTFNVGVAQKALSSRGILKEDTARIAYPIQIGVRILNNPVGAYTPFMLSGLLLNGLQIGLLLSVAPFIVRVCAGGGYEGAAAWKIIVSGVLVYAGVGLLAFTLALPIIVYGFGVPCRGDLWQIFLLAGGFVFFVTSILLTFSTLAKDEVSALQMPMFYLMPGILFSGLSWPPFAMESFARVFSCIIPFRYVGINMRDLLLAGYAPDFWQDLAVMFCAGGAALTTAIFLLRRRRKEAAV